MLPLDASGACNAIYVDDVARSVARAVMLDTGSRVAVNLAAEDRPSWRAFYGAYEERVRPGAVKEWPIDAIREAIAARTRDRRSWRAVQRALRDRRVRDRLNEIPLLAGLNTLGKSLGWRGLPSAEMLSPRRENDDAEQPALVDHLPDPVRLDLYVRAPHVDGATARAAARRDAPRSEVGNGSDARVAAVGGSRAGRARRGATGVNPSSGSRSRRLRHPAPLRRRTGLFSRTDPAAGR